MAKQTKKLSKSASVTKMLSRGTGATVAEIMKSTGWKEHSCRAFLTGVRKAQQAAQGAAAGRQDRVPHRSGAR